MGDKASAKACFEPAHAIYQEQLVRKRHQSYPFPFFLWSLIKFCLLCFPNTNECTHTQGSDHPSTVDLNRLLQEVRTALEIHAFHSADEGGEVNCQGDDEGPDSIEASFPSDLPAATQNNSPIPSPPASRRESAASSAGKAF